jgi:hypothetical protein
MPITNHRIVTGVAGGENSITNVGTGADVTWSGAVTTYPTFASTGNYYASGDGAGIINLAASNAARGTFNAWGTQGDDAKPAGATGTGYIEFPAGVSGQFVEFLNNSLFASLTTAQLQDGFEVSFFLSLVTSGAYVRDTNPANNAAQVIAQTIDTGGGAETNSQFRVLTRNRGGFAPGWGMDISSLATPTETIASVVGGGAVENPNMMLSMGSWAKVRINWERATTSTATDGRASLYINDVLVARYTSADVFVTTQAWLARLVGIGSGFNAITGVKIRYAPPIMVRTVPQADLDLSPNWTKNTADNRDLRRWYSALFSNNGTRQGGAWNISGTATLPATGTAYSTGGNNPGRSRFVIAGTVGQTFDLTLDAPVWTGGSGDSPKGENGYVWYRFSDLYTGNDADIEAIIRNGSGDTLHTIEISADLDGLIVDGVAKQTGLATSTRFEVIVGMKAGSPTQILLNDVTAVSKSATKLRRYTTAGTWDGSALGTITISGVFNGSTSAEIGGVGVYARCRTVECDSFVTAQAAGTSPALQTPSQRMGQYFNQASDATVPGGYDCISTEGGMRGIDICLNLSLSGSRLSESETHIWPQLSGCPDIHGVLICGVVNDVTAATASHAAALAAAATIAERQCKFADLCVNSGGTCWFIDAPSIVNGTGAYTEFATRVPGLVADIMPQKLRDRRYAPGKVDHSRIRGLMQADYDYIDADGIHPSGSTAFGDREMVRLAHASISIAGSMPGNNADGSVGRESRGGSSGPIGSVVGSAML